MKKTFFAAILLIAALCLGICCHAETVTEIPPEDGLPVWTPGEAYSAAELPDQADEQGIVGIYASDAGFSDVYVYRFDRDNGISLEEFGQQLAAEHNVFCNMMTDSDVPVAVLNYHDCVDGEHYIVQSYLYKAEECFVEVRTMFETEPLPIGAGDYSIHMIRDYDAQAQAESPLLFDTLYRSDNDRLPQVRICRFAKDAFPVEIIDPDLLDAVSGESLAGDGWTLQDFVSVYSERFDLLKGEVTCRNGFDHAFIGLIEEGVFYTRAFLDCGDSYILISAEAEASKFQHLTNALIDAVEKNVDNRK